jgi:hypothetical protein
MDVDLSVIFISHSHPHPPLKRSKADHRFQVCCRWINHSFSNSAQISTPCRPHPIHRQYFEGEKFLKSRANTQQNSIFSTLKVDFLSSGLLPMDES